MKDLFISILNIFSYAGKVLTFFRNVIFNILFLALLIVIVATFFLGQEPDIPNKSILRLDITGNIVEEKRILGSLEKLLGSPFGSEEQEPETLLQDVLDIISAAKDDDRVKAILLDLKYLQSGGLNQLKAIGEALTQFKLTGKKVIAAEDYYSQSQFYLASYADEIFLHPLGAIDLHGFGVYRLYYKNAMDRLAVNYHIFKVGEFKSALEPFTRNDMSDQDRQQNKVWLDALWTIYCDELSAQRHISRAVINKYTSEIDTLLEDADGDAAVLAKNLGLVDELATRFDLNSLFSDILGARFSEDNLVSGREYLASIEHRSYEPYSSDKSKIGIIVAEGNILPGKQAPGLIGSDTLTQLIDDASHDSTIKALVLRINSPGGSALASEVIRQSLMKTKKAGKPVVISMGTLAASGGYWLAVAGDQIWAAPTTLTGSIGVFGAIPTFEKTMAKIGVNSDGVGTTPLASGIDVTQPLAPQLQKAIQASVQHTYDNFVKIVAEGRGLSIEKVKKLAEGRVYDGQSAKNLGLVDHLGNLEDALKAAAELAHLKDYDVELRRPARSVRDQFMDYLTSRSSQLPLLNKIPSSIELGAHVKSAIADLQNLLQLHDPNNIYAYCQLDMHM